MQDSDKTYQVSIPEGVGTNRVLLIIIYFLMETDHKNFRTSKLMDIGTFQTLRNASKGGGGVIVTIPSLLY